MDRRDFLRTTGAAAVAGGTASAAMADATIAPAAQVHSPAIHSGVRRLMLYSHYGAGLPGSGWDRLARRIETATDGRYCFEVGLESAAADVTFGNAARHADRHRAFHIFAGLPLSQGLSAPAAQTWLTAGGGAVLWDELAGDWGFKALVVGHTGSSTGVWASTRLEVQSDLAAAKINVEGLAADVVRALGAKPVTLPADAVRAELAEGRLQAIECLGPPTEALPGPSPLAQRLYQPGLNRHGMLLTLDLSMPLWSAMSPADRALFEACAAQEYQLSLADAAAQALVSAQVSVPGKWPLRLAWSHELAAALEQAAADVVEGIAAIDPSARRIHDSHQAFRRLLGASATA